MLNLTWEENIIQKENELEKLKSASKRDEKKIGKLETEIKTELEKLYKNLTPWQRIEVARHDNRPHTSDYIKALIKDFIQLSGDRLFGEDEALLAGIGEFENTPVMIIGHEKGRGIEGRLKHHFGLPKPEGYRKAIRLMQTADRLNLPILTFIDTTGAYPGIESEERAVHEAIAKNMEISFDLKVPFISIIIGEGGSGGAIAIATANKVLMLENSFYSTITPEGLASILWKSQEYKAKAAEVAKPTAKDLFELEIIDEIIQEGIGGAHRNYDETFNNTKISIKKHLDELLKLSPDKIQEQRRQKFIQMTK